MNIIKFVVLLFVICSCVLLCSCEDIVSTDSQQKLSDENNNEEYGEKYNESKYSFVENYINIKPKETIKPKEYSEQYNSSTTDKIITAKTETDKDNKNNEDNKDNKIEEKEAVDTEAYKALPLNHEPIVAGSFIVINSVGYEKFYFNTDKSKAYVDAINYYADNLDADVKLYSLIAPTSSEFNLPEKYKNLIGSQKQAIAYVYENTDSSVIAVDAYANMDKNKSEYLYFKTDHHWTALGAYRAYEAFAESAGFMPTDIDSYKKINSQDKYLGSIYSMTSVEQLKNNTDDFWYYKITSECKYTVYDKKGNKSTVNGVIYPSYLDSKYKYYTFMSGDVPFAKIQTNINNGKNILIIKDSFGNAFIPFLLPHYSNIYVVDPRHCTKSVLDIVSQNSVKEILILDYATVLQLPAFSQMIKDVGPSHVTSDIVINATADTEN